MARCLSLPSSTGDSQYSDKLLQDLGHSCDFRLARGVIVAVGV